MKRIASIPLLLSLCWSTQSLGGDVNTPMPNKGGETNAPSETQEESSRSGNPEKSATEPRPLLPPQFGIYGFARLDAVYSSGKMAHPQVGFWALSADAPLSDESTFSVYPRYSRLGLTWDDTVETQAGGIRVSAKTEIDFFGGGSESDALPRMRVAYGDVQWRALSLRAGQDWDLFSPLFTGDCSRPLSGTEAIWATGDLNFA